jgi:hypothetical protein
MRRAEKRVYNQWQNFRGYAIGQLDRLVRDGSIPENILAPIRAALYEAEDEVRALTIGKLGARNGE